MKTILLVLFTLGVQTMSKADNDFNILKLKWALVSIEVNKMGMGNVFPALDLTSLKESPQQEQGVPYIDKIGDKQVITTEGSNLYMEIIKMSTDTVELGYHIYEPLANEDELLFTAQYIPLPESITEDRVYFFYLLNEKTAKTQVSQRLTLGYIGVLEDSDFKALQERNIIERKHENKFQWDSKYVKQKFISLQKNNRPQNESNLNPKSAEVKLFQILKKAVEEKRGLRAITTDS